MFKSDFQYDLPTRLIAQTPLPDRSGSRLLSLDGISGEIWDLRFADFPALLQPGDLLVLNDTKVVPARMFGRKPSGGRVEIMIERCMDDRSVLAMVRSSKPLATGAEIELEGGFGCRVHGRREDMFELEFLGGESLDSILDKIGHVPLPPYIDRPDNEDDRERYQTVFARIPGAVAAPTAGLHFDPALLARLDAMGVGRAFVTLHVGSGTFRPIRIDDLDQHKMHSEFCDVPLETVRRIEETRRLGARVVAVGTTVARALETASGSGTPAPYRGETDLFIRPGFRFHCVDALVTNFHLPESTLLTLVCAFGGYREVMAAYRHAVEAEYRFFSYGDAMFVTRHV